MSHWLAVHTFLECFAVWMHSHSWLPIIVLFLEGRITWIYCCVSMRIAVGEHIMRWLNCSGWWNIFGLTPDGFVSLIVYLCVVVWLRWGWYIFHLYFTLCVLSVSSTCFLYLSSRKMKMFAILNRIFYKLYLEIDYIKSFLAMKSPGCYLTFEKKISHQVT